MKLENRFYVRDSSESIQLGALAVVFALEDFIVAEYTSLFLMRDGIVYELKINYIEWCRRRIDIIPKGHTCSIYFLKSIDTILPLRGEYLQITVPIAVQQVQFAQRVSDKLARITELSHQRPMLAREQYERDTLQKILTIDSLDYISILAEEISCQAIDPELKKRLLLLAEEKKQILDI